MGWPRVRALPAFSPRRFPRFLAPRSLQIYHSRPRRFACSCPRHHHPRRPARLREPASTATVSRTSPGSRPGSGPPRLSAITFSRNTRSLSPFGSSRPNSARSSALNASPTLPSSKPSRATSLRCLTSMPLRTPSRTRFSGSKATAPNPFTTSRISISKHPAKLDLTREIEGSVRYINESLAPPGRPVRVFLWSGNCRPPPAALALARRLGLENVNGGDALHHRPPKNPQRRSPTHDAVGRRTPNLRAQPKRKRLHQQLAWSALRNLLARPRHLRAHGNSPPPQTR